MPRLAGKGNKAHEGLRTGMRTPTGVSHKTDARAGMWRRQKQVQHATGLQAGTRTTTNEARITDTEEGTGAHIMHDLGLARQ